MNTQQNNAENSNVTVESSPACELLPWYMNGTLSVAQTHLVDSHLRACVQCQEALAVWRAVQHQRLNAPVKIGDVEAGLAAMNQRLDRFVAGSPQQPDNRASEQGILMQWLRHNVQSLRTGAVFALLLLAVLGVSAIYNQAFKIDPMQTANYKTLGDVQPAPPLVPAQQHMFRVLFHRDTTDARMQAVLNRFQAQLIAGPTAKGVYTVAVPAQQLAPRQIAEMLRGEPEVLVAEWISEL